MPRWVYSFALYLLVPLVVVRCLWRGWRNRTHRTDLRMTLALASKVRSDRPLWLHAASVGEVQALAGLVRGMQQSATPPPLLVTVATPTGLAHAQELYRDLLQASSVGLPRLTVQQATWDLPGAAARFLRATQPRAAVFIENEIWPNLIAASLKQGVPLMLVSARVSVRSLGRYQRFAARLLRDAVRAFGAIAAQTEVDRQRFIALGADPACIVVGGNLKFDTPLSAAVVTQGARLRAACAPDRPLWVAGSTHPLEEEICVDAHDRLLASASAGQRARPLLVLAPRRPERFAEVARWLTARGVEFARASQGTALPASCDVLLVDAMGELLGWYAAADAAFVGGSLVPVGGHNLLEPAALGKPVLTGPYCFNAPESAALLKAAAALTIVGNAVQLAQALEGLLGDVQAAQATGARATAVVADNRGAAVQALAMIAGLPPAI